MAINDYDELLGELEEEQNPQATTGPAPAKNPYDELLSDMSRERERQLRSTTLNAEPAQPDRAAEVRRLSVKTGLPPAMIERNFDNIRKQAKVTDTPYAQMLRESPALTDWLLEEPTNAQVAKDDLEPLGFLEWITQAPGRAFARGQAQIRVGELMTAKMFRPLTQQEEADLFANKHAMRYGGELGARESWFRGAVTGAAEQLPNLFGAFFNGLQYAVPAGVTAGTGAALMGQAGPQVLAPEEIVTVPGAFAAGFGAGTLTGAAEYAFRLEAGLAYDEYLDFKDELGRSLDPEVAKAAALATGAMNAGLEAFGLGVLMKRIPGLNKLTGMVSRDAVKAALRNPTVRSGLSNAIKGYAEGLTAETSVEVAQELVTIMSGELGKYASGATTDLSTPEGRSQIGTRLVDTATQALQSFSLIALPGPAMGLAIDVRKAKAAEANVQFFQALGEGIAQSQTAQRDPGAVERFLSQAAKDSPVSTVYVDADRWTSYWQSKNLDPAEVATEATGDPAAYARAQANNEQIAIPLSRYAVKLAGTEHNGALAEELRFSPDGMNAREATEFGERLKALQGAKEPSALEAVRQSVIGQLTAAGVSRDAAASYSELYEAVFGTLAEHAGLDPVQTYQKYGLRVLREGIAPEAQPAGQPPVQAENDLSAAVSPPESAEGPGGASQAAPAGGPAAEVQPEAGGVAAATPEAPEAGTGGTGEVPATTPVLPASPVDVERAVLEATDDIRFDPAEFEDRATLSASGEAADGQPATEDLPGGGLRATERGDLAPDAREGLDVPGGTSQPLETPAGGRSARGSADPRPRGERTVEAPRRYAALVDELIDGARDQGYAGPDDPLVTQILAAIEQAESYAADMAAIEADEGANPEDLLKAISALGGLGIEAEGGSTVYSKKNGRLLGNGGAVGELETMLEGLNRNAGVIRKGPRQGQKLPRQFRRSGGLPGIPNVIVRKGGMTADMVRESINEDPRWEGKYEDLSTFLADVDDAIRQATGTSSRPGSSVASVSSVLEGLFSMRPDSDWWKDGPPVELELVDPDEGLANNASGESAASVEAMNRDRSMRNRGEQFVVYNRVGERKILLGVDAVDYVARAGETYGIEGPGGFQKLDDNGGKVPARAYDRRELDQGLFDVDETPLERIDLLSTGEQQPRLPGDVGDVRDTEVAQPELGEVGFSLEAGVDERGAKQETLFGEPHRPTKGKPARARQTDENQRELFQPAFHGTPHAFEKFELHAIGSGEGHQAFGWGLYFASQRAVAEQYRNTLSERKDWRVEGGTETVPNWAGARILQAEDKARAAAELRAEFQQRLEQTQEQVDNQVGQYWNVEGNLPGLKRIITALERVEAGAAVEKPGRVYTVDIPEDGEYLEWDQPASEQSPKVQAALQALGVTWEPFKVKTRNQMARWLEGPTADRLYREDIGIRESLAEADHFVRTGNDAALRRWQFLHQGYFNQGNVDPTGESIYRELGQRLARAKEDQLSVGLRVRKQVPIHEYAQLASTALSEQGLPGIRYLDGNSRAAGTGSANYVLFDPDLVEVKEYDQPFFHGSPHDFDRFSLANIGTGEGAQTYGWGLYFAEEPAVAEGYHERLGGEGELLELKLGSMRLSPSNGFDYSSRAHISTLENVRASFAEDLLIEQADLRVNMGRVQDFVLEQLDAKLAGYAEEGYTEGVKAGEELRRMLARPGAVSVNFAERPGAVYQVDIDERRLADMIDYDAPLSSSSQPKAFQELVRQELKRLKYLGAKDNGPRQLQNALRAYKLEHGSMVEAANGGLGHQILTDGLAKKLGESQQAEIDALLAKYGGVKFLSQEATDPADFARYNELRTEVDRIRWTHAPKAVSAMLLEQGIPGLKYFDANSRDDKKGTRNVVVWDEEIVKLTHKNGTPVTAGERAEYLKDLGQELAQDPQDGKPRPAATRRGFIRFGQDRQFNIGLMAKADLSTFLHESGHFFLEVLGDVVDAVKTQDPGTLTDKQKRLVGDYETLLSWFGATDRSSITDEHHEQFARSFEAYLLEGKAPSIALRSSFARFRSWLLGVYRSIRALKAPLTDDVRRVFDRMLATDAAILLAEQEGKVEPMFLTAAGAGMTEERFALYKDAIAAASRTAREELETELMTEMQRELSDEWRRRQNEIREQVTADANAMPVYQTLAAIRTGKQPNGEPLLEGLEPEPLKLSKEILVRTFGPDRVRSLPKPPIYVVDGGADPAIVAEMFGYSSADEMISAIESAPTKTEYIERETDRRMLAENGSLLVDGTLHEAARKATANQDRERIVREELRALGNLRRIAKPFEQAGEAAVKEERRERDYERRWLEAEAKLKVAIAKGEKQTEIDELKAEVQNLRQKRRGGAATIRAAIPPDSVIREAARERIAATRVRDLQPQIYWAASRKAAQLAIEAAARGDFEGAITLKQQELLNLALYREAAQVKDDVATRAKKAREMARGPFRQKLGLAGEDYLDQVDGILDRYDFAKATQKSLDRRKKLIEWVESLEQEGLPVDLPEEILNEALRMPYQELTVEAFYGVTDGLEQIVHLARLKNRLMKAKDQRELDAITEEIANGIRSSKPTAKAQQQRRDRRPSTEKSRVVDAIFASHRKIASLVKEMDGGVDGGPMWEAVIRPLNDAADQEAALNAKVATSLNALVEKAFPGRLKARLYEDQHIPAIGKSLSRMERIMVALNWGNEGNRDRVRRSEKWNDGQVAAVLDTLSGSEWEFVVGTWELIDSFWPEIEAKQKRVYGVAPAKVEGLEIVTKFGTVQGKYFPIKYDERLSPKAGAFADLEAGLAAKQAAYVNATTRRGHTKERVARVSMPVRRDFGVITEHLQQVVHDLAQHEALLDVGRVLGNGKVQAAIFETYGDEVYKQFKTALRDIAQGEIPAANGFEKALNHLRIGSTIAGLGWNLTTAFLQPLGLTQSWQRIGGKWVARGLGRWLKDAATMTNTVAWVTEKSAFMKTRGLTQQREIAEIRNKFGIETGSLSGWVDAGIRGATFNTVTKQGIADSYFFLIQQMQRVADVPTWIGEYEKQMASGKDEATSIALADQAVIDSQGSGYAKDLAAVQRGGPALKLWTNFYSFFNTTYNLLAESHNRTSFKNPVKIGRLAVDYALLIMVPATLGLVLRGVMKGDLPDDDEELYTALAQENAAYLMGTMLGVRELSGAVQGFTGYEGPAGARAFASLSRFGKQAAQGELDAAFWRALNDSAGVLFHFPAAQVRRTAEGVAAFSEGKTENPMVILGGVPNTGAK